VAQESLALHTAEALAGLLARRETSSVEVVESVLARIARLQPRLNCFITVCADEALAAARDSDARRAKGASLGPLDGIPYSAKDLIDTAGVRTTYGSRIHEANVPKADAVANARMKAAGAVLVGKTTTPEFGHKGFTDAPLFGVTPNAWKTSRGAGGSSGGAAVAVTSGLAPLALATDGGGSTRIPAAANGVVGLKQSVGAIPHSQSPDPFGCYTFVTPTTRTVRDTALMMQALVGAHPCDPWSYAPPDDYGAMRARERLDGVRIALLPRLGNTVVAREVLEALDGSARQLEALGAHVEPLEEAFEPIEPLWRVINHTTWRARFLPLLEKHRDVMTPTLVRQVESAEAFSAQDLMQAAFRRGELFRRAQGWLERFDALLMPTLARSALPIASNLFDPVEIDGTTLPEVRAAWFPYTMPWNLTGHPAITLPTGLDADGLPLAVQLVGRFRDDAGLLGLAAVLEACGAWNARLASA